MRETCFPTKEPVKNDGNNIKEKVSRKGKGENMEKTVQSMKCS